MHFTKRNHYNPCFWTALWNPDYYSRATRGKPLSSPRKEVVHSLNVKSGKCRTSTTERIHFDKGLGEAEITREVMHDFAKRWYPDRYEQFIRDDANSPYPVYIDFEEVLTKLESLPPYQILIRVGLSKKIETPEEKYFLACFVFIQSLRSHAIMKSMIDWHHELRQSKFEHFVTLKWMLSDTPGLFRQVIPLISGKWTLYSPEKHSFPLCDTAVLAAPGSLMVPLSPQLLLEINPEIQSEIDLLPEPQVISSEKFEEFRRRTIGNTFREIIGDKEILAKWQKSPEFIARTEQMKDVKTYNTLVAKEGERELWHLNAFGNQQ